MGVKHMSCLMTLKLLMGCWKLLGVLEGGLQARELPDGLGSANEAFGDAKSVGGGCQAQDLPDDPETVNEVLGVAKSFGKWA